MKIFWGDLVPLAAGEPERLEARLTKLVKIEPEASKAEAAFRRISIGRELLVRWRFAVRYEPAESPWDPSDRRLPPRRERPPATRLASPRGIALRFYLTALLVALSRSPGERPSNTLPLDDRDQTSWIDLVATPAERFSATISVSVRDKKLRQVQDALRRLSHPEVQLVTLPNWRNATGKYEGFLLMNEAGAPYDGGSNETYRVPTQNTGQILRLPAGLFLNSWIHVLEDSELAFLLMLACLHARFSNEAVFAAGDLRLLQFGLGRDAYQAHKMLRRFGLVDVEEDPNRHLEGQRVRGYSKDNPPKLHRFRLLTGGFDQPAIPTMREAIEHRLGKPG